MRRITADTSGPDWRTISCHAASPFELFPTWTFHKPATAGIFVASAATGTNRFAVNGYGAPRVPREYSPSRRPSLSVASSFVPSSSKLSDSLPFSSEPLVDVVFSSPLKNEPLTLAPEPDSSNRNGISRAPLLTRTVASHRPLSDCAPAVGGNPISARITTTRAPSFVDISNSPRRKKARQVVNLSGLLSS